MAVVRSCWVSSNAVTDGSRLQVAVRWVHGLTFGALPRLQSSITSRGRLRRAHDSSETSELTDYVNSMTRAAVRTRLCIQGRICRVEFGAG